MTVAVASKLVVVDLISEDSGLRFEVAGRMAEAIKDYKRRHGGCVPQDLNAKGFTPSEVVDNWDAAHFLIEISDLETWGKNNGKDKSKG